MRPTWVLAFVLMGLACQRPPTVCCAALEPDPLLPWDNLDSRCDAADNQPVERVFIGEDRHEAARLRVTVDPDLFTPLSWGSRTHGSPPQWYRPRFEGTPNQPQALAYRTKSGELVIILSPYHFVGSATIKATLQDGADGIFATLELSSFDDMTFETHYASRIHGEVRLRSNSWMPGEEVIAHLEVFVPADDDDVVLCGEVRVQLPEARAEPT